MTRRARGRGRPPAPRPAACAAASAARRRRARATPRSPVPSPTSDRRTGRRRPSGTSIASSWSGAGCSGSQASPSRNARSHGGFAVRRRPRRVGPARARAAAAAAPSGPAAQRFDRARSASRARRARRRRPRVAVEVLGQQPVAQRRDGDRPRRGSRSASSTRSHSVSRPIDRLLRFAEPTRAQRSSTIITLAWTFMQPLLEAGNRRVDRAAGGRGDRCRAGAAAGARA